MTAPAESGMDQEGSTARTTDDGRAIARAGCGKLLSSGTTVTPPTQCGTTDSFGVRQFCYACNVTIYERGGAA